MNVLKKLLLVVVVVVLLLLYTQFCRIKGCGGAGRPCTAAKVFPAEK